VRHLAELIDSDPDLLGDALRLLMEPDSALTIEQRDLLLTAINARTAAKLIAPETARLVSIAETHLAELAQVEKLIATA
jgi:hypothetical protein